MSYKELRKYYCLYCGHRFKQVVGSTGGAEDYFGGKVDCVSSQVQCPRCNNFLKTWEGILVKESKLKTAGEKLMGQK